MKKGQTIVNLTLNLKVTCQGHVNNLGFFEITDLELVRINTKIKSVSCIQTKDNEGHIKVSLTLTFKVNRQGHVIGFVFFEIPDLEKVRIDTEILSVLLKEV